MMHSNRQEMNILSFVEKFPDEQSCKEHFRLQREKEGIKCKKCGCEKHYWLKAKHQWQCSSCRFRTCLRSGTTFEHSKLPIRKWYLAMALMSMTKKGLSAKEMQRQLGHKRYATIWRMMHTIRAAMGNREGVQNVAVAAESTPLEDVQTGKKSKHCGYFKMKVLSGHDALNINDTVSENIDEKSIVFSDKSKSYEKSQLRKQQERPCNGYISPFQI